MKFSEARKELIKHKKHVFNNGATSNRFVNPGKKNISLVLDSLENYYAPTVEISKEGYDTLMLYLNTSTLQDFFSFVVDDYDTYYRMYSNVSIEDLMTIWLFPETAKVVG